MASDIKEAIRRLIYQYTVEGAEKVMATQDAVTAATTKTDQAALSLDKSFNNLERRYESTVRYQQDYQKVQERVNAAVAQNPELQERANAVLAAASQHYDNLSAKASGSSIAVSLISKEFVRLIGFGGALGLAIEGIRIGFESFAEAAGKSRTTVAQALEEQNRLMAEAKKLIDERTSAQDRMFARSKDEVGVQLAQNEIDMQEKLLAIQRKVATAASEAVGTTALPGAPALEMPKGIQEMLAAAQKLQQAIAADKSGLVEFNAEIGRIGAANPDLKKMEDAFLRIGQEAGTGLQEAITKSQAASQALDEVKTNAQAVALGFASLAQFNFSQLGADQAAAAMERMANYANQLAVAYPDLSTSAAKQHEILQATLAVAQARTEQEKLTAQQYLDQLQYQQQGLGYEDQLVLSADKRAIAEANASKQMAATQNAQIQQESAQSDVTSSINNSTRAETSFGNAAQRVYQYVVWTEQSLSESIDKQLDLMGTDFGKEQMTISVDPLNQQPQKAALEQAYGADMVKATSIPVGALGAITVYSLDMDKYIASLQAAGQSPAAIGMQDVSSPAAASASLANTLSMGLQNGLTNVERVINAVTDKGTQASLIQQAIGYIQSTQPPNLARDEMINELNDKLTQLTSSTDSLNSTMQNALSPFYSQDPRTTHLGFRAGVVGNEDWLAAGAGTQSAALAALLGVGATAPGMADGGSFVVGGGYSANDNRIAMFPVASGEQVVVNRNRAGQSGQVVQNIDARTIIQGSLDQDALGKLKVSKYQQIQRMRAGLLAAA